PGSSGANAKNQIVPLNRFYIAPLIDGFGRERFLAEVSLASAVHQAAQSDFRIFSDYPQIAVEIAVAEALAFFHQGDVVLQNARGADDVGLIAFDFERIVQQTGGDLQSIFEDAYVFIAGPKKGLNAACDLNAYFHLIVSLRCMQEQQTSSD